MLTILVYACNSANGVQEQGGRSVDGDVRSSEVANNCGDFASCGVDNGGIDDNNAGDPEDHCGLEIEGNYIHCT